MESQQSTISDKRQSNSQYRLFRQAVVAAQNSTCPREKHGCIIAREGIVVSTGYNGSGPGDPHCDEVGCDEVESWPAVMKDKIWGKGTIHCVRTIHSEINAITNAAILGVSIADRDWYITGVPCWGCARVIMRTSPRSIWLCTERGGVDATTRHKRIDYIKHYGMLYVGYTVKGMVDRGILREGEL